MNIQIVVAAHRPYWFPDDEIYLPLQVGAFGKEDIHPGIVRDDKGQNISTKNSTFCELTGLYWAWKNLDADIIGLCHYRRYFTERKLWKEKTDRLLKANDIALLLGKSDLILPEKRHYWIETRKNQYAHAHHIEDLICTGQALREKYPELLPEWEKMLASRSGHICNMFIMKKELLNDYCCWLFDILFTVESRLDISGYSEKDRRVYGYLGERLLDVWIASKDLIIEDVPVINFENEH